MAVSVATADKIRERKLAAQAAYRTRSGTQVSPNALYFQTLSEASLLRRFFGPNVRRNSNTPFGSDAA